MAHNHCRSGCSCDSTGMEYVPCSNCGHGFCPDIINVENGMCEECEYWENKKDN